MVAQTCLCRSARLACLRAYLRDGCVGGGVGGGGIGWGLQSPDFLTLPLSDTCERSVGSLCLSTLLCNHKVQMTPPAARSLPWALRRNPTASPVRSEKKNPTQISKWSQRMTKLRLHMHTLKSYQWLASIGGYSNTCDWLTANSGNKDCFSIKKQSCEFGRVTQGWCAPQGLLELSAHFSSVTISNPHSTWFQFCAKSMNAECYCLKSLIVNCKWSCGSRGWLWWEFLSCHLACKSGDVTRLLWLHFTISAAFKQACYIC